jgi:hypothetical protein
MMVFKPILIETKYPKFPLFNIEYTRFVRLFRYVVTSFLKAKFSIPNKLNNLSKVYYITYFFIRSGFVGKKLLRVL